jgi:hypothetical protein
MGSRSSAVSKALGMAFRRPGGGRILGFGEEWYVGSDGVMMNGEGRAGSEGRKGRVEGWGEEGEELDVLVSRGILFGGPAGKAM